MVLCLRTVTTAMKTACLIPTAMGFVMNLKWQDVLMRMQSILITLLPMKMAHVSSMVAPANRPVIMMQMLTRTTAHVFMPKPITIVRIIA